MKKIINVDDFVEAFQTMNRTENFSREGRIALFKYLEDYENDCGIEIEIDVIAICCEFTEYKNFEELQNNYDIETIEELEERTTVIRIDNKSFIIQQF